MSIAIFFLDIMSLQNNLANYSFLTLLISMIFYWMGTSLSPREDKNLNRFPSATGVMSPVLLKTGLPKGQEESPLKETETRFFKLENRGDSQALAERDQFLMDGNALSPNWIRIGLPSFPQGGLVPSVKEGFLSHFFNLQNLAKYGMIISNILLGFLLVLRWKESGHFPLSNLYESLMFLSWCFTGIHIFVENWTFEHNIQENLGQTKLSLPTKESSSGSGTARFGQKPLIQLLGAITTPSALFTNAFATFTLPKGMQDVAPLVPALQSNWLVMHVTVMILSYAALIIGSLLSMGFLILTGGKEEKLPLGTAKPPIDLSQLKSNQIASTLDNLSYRILGIGFPLLTIGILSGAVWANEAWGSYWSWDPKETWALLTWLVFAIYLHTRLSKGWEGKKPAMIASFGFVIIWMCYLGVNLLGEGLHSYGWIVKS